MAKPESTEPAPTEPADPSPLDEALNVSPVEDFLENNQALVGGALVLLVLIVSGVIVGRGLQANARQAAAMAYAEADSIRSFERVAEDHAGSVAAGNALIRKAGLLEEEGRIDEARAALVGFLERYKKHPLRDQALIILGRMAIDEGNTASARDFYSRVGDDSAFAPLAQIRLGDLALQEGDVIAARDIYEPLIRTYPEHAWMNEWNQRMAQVNAASDAPDEDASGAEFTAPETGPAEEEAEPEAEAPRTADEDSAPPSEDSPKDEQPVTD